MAENLVSFENDISYCQKVVQAAQPEDSTRVEEIKKELMEEYKNTVFRAHFGGMSPKRGTTWRGNLQPKTGSLA